MLIFLKFKNAGWFSDNPREYRDFVIEYNTYDSRRTQEMYKSPITYHQISGMLHVLMGERPKPSLRYSVYNEIESITEVAKNALIKVDCVFKTKNYSQNSVYDAIQSDIFRTKKSVWNSNSLNSYYSWATIKSYLGDIVFAELIQLFNSTLCIDDPLNYNAVDILERFNAINQKQDNIIDFKNFLVSIKRKAFVDLMNDYKNPDGCKALNMFNKIYINSGIANITKLNGEIIIEVDDIMVEKIRNNNGFATLLDGGLVYITDIKDEYSFNPNIDADGFIRVGDISTEKGVNNNYLECVDTNLIKIYEGNS